MLLRTLLAWLRGEPRVCSMVRIPSVAEEDMPSGRAVGPPKDRLCPERERERLVSERIALENRIENLLCLHGIVGFKPRLKKATERLDELRCYDGGELPPDAMDELKRIMLRHHVLSDQLKEIETARAQVATAAEPDRTVQQIQMLAGLFGLGLATATGLAREVFYRTFRDRKAIASFVGLTGTPFSSGGTEREQGISKNGNPRIRRLLMQLAWRWLRMQPDSALSCWFVERTGDAKGRIRKIMAVALARKLLVALWRYVETGEVPAGARLSAA